MPRRAPKTRPVARLTYHHKDLARALTDRAEGVIAERGPAGIVLSEIARAEGVSHAALYRHFADKEALVAAVGERGFARLFDALARARSRAPVDAEAAFLHMGRTIVEFALASPGAWLAMFGSARGQDLRVLEAAPAETPFGATLELIGEWQARGLLRAAPPMSHALAMWAVTHGLSGLALAGFLPARASARHKVIDDVHRALLDGIRAPAPVRRGQRSTPPPTSAPSPDHVRWKGGGSAVPKKTRASVPSSGRAADKTPR